MREKIPSISVITLIVLVTAGTCLAGEPDRFEQAGEYENSRDYEKAEQIYLGILQESAQTDDALQALERLTCLYITWAKLPEAEAALQQLLGGFSQHKGAQAAVTHVADTYRTLERHQEACELYNYVIGTWPQDEYAMWSQIGMTISYEEQDDVDAAEAAYNKLLTDLAQRQLTDEEIYWIAKRFNWAKQNDRAAGIHRYNVEKFPGDKFALWSQVEVAYHHIRTGDESGSDAAVEKFLSVFAGHPVLPRDVYNVAKEYDKAGRLDKALELYQYVIDHRPTDEDIYARMSASMAYIGLSDDANALSVTDGLIADFNKHTDLAGVVFHIGEQYYERAFRLEGEGFAEQSKSDFRNAAAVWQRIITDLPLSEPNTPLACYFSGVCYGRLHDYQKAIEYYQVVVDNFPDFRLAWIAQFRIVKIYKRLLITGAISDSEANAAIKVAFEHLVESFPDCPAAEAARNWLDRNPETKEGE